jgi:hypothetical protein
MENQGEIDSVIDSVELGGCKSMPNNKEAMRIMFFNSKLRRVMLSSGFSIPN